MAATAAIFKILLLLLLRNYWMNFNQISRSGSWWCLVVPYWNSERFNIQDAMAAILKILLLTLPDSSKMASWKACYFKSLEINGWILTKLKEYI